MSDLTIAIMCLVIAIIIFILGVTLMFLSVDYDKKTHVGGAFAIALGILIGCFSSVNVYTASHPYSKITQISSYSETQEDTTFYILLDVKENRYFIQNYSTKEPIKINNTKSVRIIRDNPQKPYLYEERLYGSIHEDYYIHVPENICIKPI